MVRVDADLGGDRHRLSRDGFGGHVAHRSAPAPPPARRCRQSRSHQVAFRLQHVAGAGQGKRRGPGRPPASWLRGAAESGPCASPWPAPRRRASSWPGICSSLASSRSNRVKASAVAPAKPPITSPLPRRRTLRALRLDDGWPSETWPSPATTSVPPLRTVRMVVPCQPIGSALPPAENHVLHGTVRWTARRRQSSHPRRGFGKRAPRPHVGGTARRRTFPPPRFPLVLRPMVIEPPAPPACSARRL